MKNINTNKLFGIALAVIIVFSLVACNDGAGSTTDKTGNSDTTGGKIVIPIPPPFPDEPREEIEVKTDGQLTITGLDAYENREIFAGRETFDNFYITEKFDFAAYDKAYNLYYPNKNETFSSPLRYAGTVSKGKVVLKVFKRTSSSSGFDNYNGTEKVKLNIYMNTILSNDERRFDVYGTVTVEFVNGVGEGVFVPN